MAEADASLRGRMSSSNGSSRGLPRLYQDLAEWWPLLSAPEEHAEEAGFYRQAILSAAASRPLTLLELGSGGGNNASHLKKHFQMTLVDLSPGMLQVSRRLNPECEHVEGDMRTARLGRQFDAVFVHDAIAYMTTEQELALALATAFDHCKPGGVALLAPDHTKENFRTSTEHGGHDRGDSGLRYLEWTWDPDPGDTTYESIMVYVLREGDRVQSILDRHVCGLFSHDRWLGLMSEVGFEAWSIPFEHSEVEPGSCDVFLGLRP
jgi:SAM-dependent methyltransferase